MFKRISLILMAVVVIALALSGIAFADASALPADGGARWGRGEVTAVGADSFTFRNLRDQEHTVYVDEGTSFTDQDGRPISFSDVKVGDRVLGAAAQHDDGKWYAVIVHVFPPRTHYQGAGVASSVSADEFVFTSRRGKVWEFYVDESTAFTDRQGNPLTYADVKVGSRLLVKAELRADDKWWATEVKIGIVPNPYARLLTLRQNHGILPPK